MHTNVPEVCDIGRAAAIAANAIHAKCGCIIHVLCRTPLARAQRNVLKAYNVETGKWSVLEGK